MTELSEENLKLAKELGYSDEQAKDIVEKAGRVIPSLTVPDIVAGKKEGEKVICTFDTKEIKTVETTGPDPADKSKTVKKKAQVTTVVSGEKIQYTLWLTSESMKRAYLQLRALHQGDKNGIKGVKVAIYKVKVNYPVYGEGIAYRIQEIGEQDAKKVVEEQKLEKAAAEVPAEAPAAETPTSVPEPKAEEPTAPEASAEKKEEEFFE